MNPKDLVGSKKAPLGLVPPALEIGAAEAMENGALKYGPFNWREQPIEYMTYLVAMKRHISALIDGQDLAEDTQIHHLKHIVAGGGILLDALHIPGGLIDNRPPKGPAADMLRALDKSRPAVLDLGPDVEAEKEELRTWLRAALDGTEGGDVLPDDEAYPPVGNALEDEKVGCEPTACIDPTCGIHNPVMGHA